MKFPALAGLVAGVILAPAWGQPATETGAPPAASAPTTEQTAATAHRLAGSLRPPQDALAAEVLARNPDLARARRQAVAAELRAPQVGSLPDPVATLTPFLAGPETRVGPQLLAAGLSQHFPWFGKLALRERAALYAAAAARAQAEEQAVRLVTETRRLYYELAFLDAREEVVRADRATLEHFEELARARYASGIGLEQTVVKIQAEITKDDDRLLDVADRRATLTATLNALRDAPPGAPLPTLALPEEVPLPELPLAALEETALAARPEVAAARARIAEAETRVELAEKEYSPDLRLGLSYVVVGERDDPAGRAMPPRGNGDDVIGLTAGIDLPVWRKRLAAGVEEAAQRVLAAQDGLRGVAAGIRGELADLLARIPLTADQHALFTDVLTVQAEEALRSAEAAYSTGNLGSLDLLDAERVLLEVRIATARTRADLAIAVARLEGAAATPLSTLPSADGDPEPDPDPPVSNGDAS